MIIRLTKTDFVVKLLFTLIIYLIWFFIANREFSFWIALSNLGLSYMAASGLYFHCGLYEINVNHNIGKHHE